MRPTGPDLLRLLLQLGVELLEQIFEQQRDQLTRELEPLVPCVGVPSGLKAYSELLEGTLSVPKSRLCWGKHRPVQTAPSLRHARTTDTSTHARTHERTNAIHGRTLSHATAHS